MSKARLVITAIEIEGRTVADVVATYGVSKSWTYELLARYRAEGEAAFEPRSRRPRTSPTAISDHTVELIIELRKKLTEAGLDAGPDTIAWHLEHHHQVKTPPATVSRTLTRQGLVEPSPKKRPKSSYIRFQAAMPNETWQSDFTHYRLSTGADTEIITWLDDHARYALHVCAHRRVTGPVVVDTFTNAAGQHGYPASVLTDNGMVYTTRFSGLESELRRLDIVQKNTRPNHPTQPPDHDRESGAVPADDEEVVDRSAHSAGHDHRTPGPHRRLRRAVQPPPPAPVTATPSHTERPRPPPIAPGPRPPPASTEPARPTTACCTTSSTTTANSPCASTADSTTSASAGPTAEPGSSSSSTTSTSASSTPPQENSSASSPSTPAATTNPPAEPPAQTPETENPDPN